MGECVCELERTFKLPAKVLMNDKTVATLFAFGLRRTIDSMDGHAEIQHLSTARLVQ